MRFKNCFFCILMCQTHVFCIYMCPFLLFVFPHCFQVVVKKSRNKLQWPTISFNLLLGFLTTKLHPGWLTWNLQITHLERKWSEPNLHDYVQNVNLPGCIASINQDPTGPLRDVGKRHRGSQSLLRFSEGRLEGGKPRSFPKPVGRPKVNCFGGRSRNMRPKCCRWFEKWDKMR